MSSFGIFMICVMVVITFIWIVPIIIAIRKKDFDFIISILFYAICVLSICYALCISSIAYDIETKNAETYTTNDFTFIYETKTKYECVKFIDAYGREQELEISDNFPTNRVNVCDENKLTYKILSNKKRRCVIDEVCITEELAEAVKYDYNQTLTASTHEVKNDE